ncbi:tyrosine-protein phosphatase [Novosphingobium sp. CECT 9465]|uniref:tyrosine-protein phosphatase n=1 Tax=Novosphingobium sp. CECT 9465 TaxID=2829794 RepID=UPI001E3D7EAC|nr:tyrosine-protein phosphatase [Novosphingobium sp. CECT 9465]CAH0495335.1 Tyrosine-protein phosphatase [Novosphingobium sp. CECT 9465]
MTFHQPYQPMLIGGCNLRDLGGHETADGREVRKGVLYRSGVLAYLTPSDHCCLARSQIRTIVDLRRPDEIAEEPTEWALPVRQFAYRLDAEREAAQKGAPWMQSGTPEEARTWMIESYRSMHEWLATPLRAIFDAILDQEMAVLFHCAAGKDRTGFCAAIVLGLLGVSESTILEEYAFTEKAIDLLAFAATHRAARLGLAATREITEGAGAGMMAVLTRADPDYLRAGLNAVITRYGSVEGYVQQAVGLTDEQIATVRYQLLED